MSPHSELRLLKERVEKLEKGLDCLENVLIELANQNEWEINKQDLINSLKKFKVIE